jgi:CubicO group peptidase (beta-lactamase class C family)
MTNNRENAAISRPITDSRIFTRAARGMIPLMCVVPLLAGAQTTRRPSDEELIRRVESYVAPFAAHELSGTLLVARGDRVLVERSFGFANYELGVRFTPTTPTNVASITKPLTVIITSQLAEARRLSVKDTVSKWLPEYVYGKRITVTQLLNHHSGVPHRLLPDDAQSEPRTTDDMVRAANAMPLLFEPGSREMYSSGGYAILAAVLERVTGKGYDALLQEMVARPVGARTIRHTNSRELLPGRAMSALPLGTTVLNAPLRDLSFLVGGGSVFTTPHDLFLVMQGLVRGKYGAAARVALLDSAGMHWNGLTNGYRAFADWIPADSLTVIFTGNTHTGAIDLLRRVIPQIAAGANVKAPEVPNVTPAALSAATQARLAGNYDTGGGSLSALKFLSPTIVLFGDRTLVPLNDSTLYSFADYARVIFTSNGAGKVEAIQWGAGTWGTGELGPRFARVP